MGYNRLKTSDLDAIHDNLRDRLGLLRSTAEDTPATDTIQFVGPDDEQHLLDAIQFYYQSILDRSVGTIPWASIPEEPAGGTTYVLLTPENGRNYASDPLMDHLARDDRPHVLLSDNGSSGTEGLVSLDRPIPSVKPSFPGTYLLLQLLGACLENDEDRIERLLSVAGELRDQFRRSRVAVDTVLGVIDHPLNTDAGELVEEIPGLDPDHPNQKGRRWALPENPATPVKHVQDIDGIALAGGEEFQPLVREGQRYIEERTSLNVRVLDPAKVPPEAVENDPVVILSNFRTESRDARWVKDLVDRGIPVVQTSCCLSEIDADWLFHVTRRSGPEDADVLYLPYLYQLGNLLSEETNP